MGQARISQRIQQESVASDRQLWKIGQLAGMLDKSRKEVLDRFIPDNNLVENGEGKILEHDITKYDASELIRELSYRVNEKERRL